MVAWIRNKEIGPLALGRRLVDLLGPTGDAVRQSLTALVFNSMTSLIAGAILGSITHTFEALPGLLVMVPAAIGLRGNIFGALGNRISTSIHLGTFNLSTRRDTVLGQNILASLSLTYVLSVTLAIMAKLVAVTFGIENSIGVLDLAVISIVGGTIASIIVLVATIALSAASVRQEWDLDNLVAPTMSTLGDALTVPSLFFATYLVGHGMATKLLGWLLVVGAIIVLVLTIRSKLEIFTEIVRESLPVLAMAAVLSTLAGIAVEKQLALFAALPALLIMQPAFVSSAGALGGILSSRISTNLHLGLVEPSLRPQGEARRDALLVLLIGFPIFVFNAVGAHVTGLLLNERSPGLFWILAASLLGGLLSVLFVIALAYYGTIAAWRSNLDPDNYGIPIVTASVDFVGVVALVLVLSILGIR
ncbi:MAG: magnesium transporter [Microthrixaceae bacterium]